MKAAVLFVGMMTLMAASVAARADGFTCETVDGSLNVKIYNHTSPEEGTRTAAVLVLSDPAVSQGRKTIARFTDVNGVLESQGTRYSADVDLRFADSSRKGELILGTKLGQLETVNVMVDHNYAFPIARGEQVGGEIRLEKRDGSTIREDLVCTRYLKGE